MQRAAPQPVRSPPSPISALARHCRDGTGDKPSPRPPATCRPRPPPALPAILPDHVSAAGRKGRFFSSNPRSLHTGGAPPRESPFPQQRDKVALHCGRNGMYDYRRKRGMARRRSPPVGAEAQTPPGRSFRRSRDSGRALPYAARQRGGRRTSSAIMQAGKEGCPSAG